MSPRGRQGDGGGGDGKRREKGDLLLFLPPPFLGIHGAKFDKHFKHYEKSFETAGLPNVVCFMKVAYGISLSELFSMLGHTGCEVRRGERRRWGCAPDKGYIRRGRGRRKESRRTSFSLFQEEEKADISFFSV